MFALSLLLAISQAAGVTAPGARSGENAVRSAEDAFGQSVGRESIGLYDAGQVRGFSPVAAGNVRLDGLYFDAVWTPSDRISGSTAIQVGLSALDSVHPAPTGLVDFGLRRPGDVAAASALVGLDGWGGYNAEFDGVAPLGGGLTLGLGAATFLDSNWNGTRGGYGQAAAMLRWTPAPALELVSFLDVERAFFEETGPIYLPIPGTLPPTLPRRRFTGPEWARYRGNSVNTGALGRWQVGSEWILRAGLFRSAFDSQAGFANLMTEVTPAGSARQVIVADPPLLLASTSGEIRISREWSMGASSQRLHLSLRGRRAFRRFDGSIARDLGPTDIRTPVRASRPSFAFGTQQRDRVRQWTPGLAWEVRSRALDVSLGAQRTIYSKRVGLAERPPVATDSRAWLYNANGTLRLSGRLSVYGGTVTGLEESGIAPDNAANRNEALPAIRTRQVDAGVAWRVGNDLNLVAGVFRLTKPYFNLDAAGRFGPLGRTVSQGLELSIAGPVTGEVSLVAGAVLARPRVTRAPGVGPRPVGAIARRAQAALDWRPAAAPGLSFDLTVSHRSPETATVDNRVAVPARTLLDLGGRYAFSLAGREATLRLQVENALDQRGLDLVGAGAFEALAGRYLSAYLTIDF